MLVAVVLLASGGGDRREMLRRRGEGRSFRGVKVVLMGWSVQGEITWPSRCVAAHHASKVALS